MWHFEARLGCLVAPRRAVDVVLNVQKHRAQPLLQRCVATNAPPVLLVHCAPHQRLAPLLVSQVVQGPEMLVTGAQVCLRDVPYFQWRLQLRLLHELDVARPQHQLRRFDASVIPANPTDW